jgi:hypothetical protein
MADPRAFISFDFDHNHNEKILFAGQSKHSKTPFNIEDWSSKSHLPQNEWEKLIEEKIKKCNMLIVLVGRYMASATGAVKEISFANKHNIPVFGVYVDGANSTSNLPTGLPRNRTINWEWDAIASAISQVMKEGRNK